MKGKTVFLSTALAGALAAASAAHAVDVKVFPGNACQAAFGNEAADLGHGVFLLNGGAANRIVVCPIVRDNHRNRDGVRSVGVRVSSLNGITLTCALSSVSAGGNLLEANTNSTTSTVVTNLPLDIDRSTNNGTYVLFCELPPGGQVLSYRVIEF
ncbi:MAG: hypothetical protein LC647_04590 [Beggiatoa sp.]|nr:hypothetical protein [Beggiatoa sp.]